MFSAVRYFGVFDLNKDAETSRVVQDEINKEEE